MIRSYKNSSALADNLSVWSGGKGLRLLGTNSWGRTAVVGVALVVVAALLSPSAQAIFVLAVAAVATATVHLVTCRRGPHPPPWGRFLVAGTPFACCHPTLLVVQD